MPSSAFKGKSGLGLRGDVLLQLDWSVGRILKKLDALGLAENTMVIFSSDNGPVLDDGYVDGAVEKLNGHNPLGPLRGGKYSAFEGGTRVPFLVRWPAGIKPGTVSPALIGQIDLLASFSRFLGQTLKEGDAPDSENMFEALTGATEKGRDILVEHGATFSLVRGSWKYIEPSKGPEVAAHTGVELGNNRDPQLYDLSDDIGERTNLAAKYPAKVEELKKELEKIRSRR